MWRLNTSEDDGAKLKIIHPQDQVIQWDSYRCHFDRKIIQVLAAFKGIPHLVHGPMSS